MNIPSHEILQIAWAQSWQVALLIAAVALATRLLSRHRPHLAYVLWMLVVLKCLTPPLWSSPMGLFSWAQARTSPGQPQRLAAGAAHGHLPPGETAGAASTGFLPAPHPLQTSAVPARIAPTATSVSPSPDRGVYGPFGNWPTSLAAIWMIGLAALAAAILLRWRRCWPAACHSSVPAPPELQALLARMKVQLRVRQRVRLLVTAAPVGPAVAGLVRPVVIIPQALLATRTIEQIRPILAHELAHVRRGDVLFGLLQSAAQLLLWFHPLVWWANRRASQEVERCCDEETVADLGCSPAVYARCLVDVLQFKHDLTPLLTVPGIRPRGVTRQRLEDIMQRTGGFQRRTPLWCWLVLLAMALLVLPGRGRTSAQTSAVSHEAGTTASLSGEEGVMKDVTIVTGQVLDPSGRPVPATTVAALVRSPTSDSRPGPAWVLAQSQTDAQGELRLSGRRVSQPRDLVLTVVAYRPGYAVAWKQLDINLSSQQAKLQFAQQKLIAGQAVDEQGKPAAGVSIALQAIVRNPPAVPQWTAVLFPDKGLVGGPEPVVTDAQGRFTLTGLRGDEIVEVRAHDERFAPLISTDLKAAQAPLKLQLTPPLPVQGIVVRKGDNAPVPDALVEVLSWYTTGNGGYIYTATVQGHTDYAGHFRVIPYQADFLSIRLTTPQHGTYELVKWQDAKPILASPQTLVVPQGVVIDGVVLEAPGDKPVSGATVVFQSRDFGPSVMTHTGTDGKFVLTVGPDRGALLVRAPTPDYLKQIITEGEAMYGKEGGRREYPDGLAMLDLKPGGAPQQVTIRLQRGVTVRGQVIDPDGQPVAKGVVALATYAPYDINFHNGQETLPIANGQFAVPGLDPEREQRVYFADPQRQCGATVMLSGKTPQPVVIHLQPCGLATARFVDQDGRPYAHYQYHQPPYIHVALLLAPGSSEFGFVDAKSVSADIWSIANVDPLRYEKLRADADGRMTFPMLIPGADYRVIALRQKDHDYGRKDFTVQPGQTIDLGQIVADRGKD